MGAKKKEKWRRKLNHCNENSGGRDTTEVRLGPVPRHCFNPVERIFCVPTVIVVVFSFVVCLIIQGGLPCMKSRSGSPREALCDSPWAAQKAMREPMGDEV